MSADGVSSVVFCAMGGSAAAGDLIAAAYRDAFVLPVGLHRGYTLPSYAGRDTLVVCVSYSGNTEETLAAYGEAVRRGCRVGVVASGGTLADRAEEDGVPFVEVPSGIPMPRAALGHLAGACLGLLGAAGLVTESMGLDEIVEGALAPLAERLGPDSATPENHAKDIAGWIGDRVPVVWGSEGIAEPAAWRWKCAFNENAKIPAFSASLPELDHHEVAGWSAGRGVGFALLVLRHDGEHPSIDRRVSATLAAIQDAGLEHREVLAEGELPIVRGLALMLTGDATSTYHAMARGIDPMPIEAIDRVKKELA